MKILKILPVIISLMLIPGITPLYAQEEFEDFFDSADDEFKKLKKQADDEFADLRKSVDKEFGELLENAWKEFELARGLVRDTTPKPVTPPVARPSDVPEEPEKVPEITPPDKEKVTPSPEPEIKPEPEPEPPEAPTPPPAEKPETKAAPPPVPSQPGLKTIPMLKKSGEPLSFKFYDTLIQITYDMRWESSKTVSINDETIRSFWNRYSQTNYTDFLEQALYIREKLGLNDWGYCRLMDYFSAGICGTSNKERPLFIWFMLVQSGFDARIGYNDNNAYLLIPSSNTVYGAPFYELDKVKYYITFLGAAGGEVNSLFTYEGKHKGAAKNIDFNMYSSPEFGEKSDEKILRFKYTDQEYQLAVKLNKNMIDFYEFYPQIDLDVYFRASISPQTVNSLLNGLKPIIRDKSEGEAVNILLRFVQTAFKYQTDDEQFGEENYLFPEESLFFPYCDCEDRSFLFAHLVGDLLGLDVVGLKFPGHVATAVKFNTNVSGDSITYNNQRYIICDPTYINANFGQCMPQFKNVTPGIIQVEKM